MNTFKALSFSFLVLMITVVSSLWIYRQGDIVHTVAADVITNPTVETLTFAIRDSSYAVLWNYGNLSFNTTWFGITLCLIFPLCTFFLSFRLLKSLLKNNPSDVVNL